MSETTDAGDAGALSVDAAVGLLDEAAERREDGDQVAAEPGGDAAGQDPEHRGALDAEALEAPAERTLEAPAGWGAEARERFAALPPELQTWLQGRDAEREQAVGDARRQAAEARAQAAGELDLVRQLADQLSGALPQVLAEHQNRWGANPDWEAVADQMGVDEAFRLKTQWEKERTQLAELARGRAEAERIAHARFVADETEKLKVMAPALADPREGEARRREMGHYLLAQGATMEQLRHLGALEASIAWKAMQWDRAQATLRGPSGGQRNASPPRPTLRSGAGQPQTSQHRNLDALARRLSQTGTVDDAVALLNARKRA
jgi:hypothetical protein